MKKKIILSVMLIIISVILIISAISLTKKMVINKRETTFVTASTKFFNSYMSGIKGVDEVVITLEMLETAVSEQDEEYDLSSLKKCSSDSKIAFRIEKGNLIKQKVQLNCK